MRYRLQISYDGGSFNGWQKQQFGPPTVQGTLETIISCILQKPTRVVGSGRTDTGVHALAQVAHFDCDKELTPSFLRSLNAMAPDGLVVASVWRAPDDFHAMLSAIGKTYIYRVWNGPQPSVFRRRTSHWVSQKLDLEKLNGLSEALVGEIDFKSFQSRGTPVKTTVRHVSEAHWRPIRPNLLEFRISGEGFLKQMVRNIVGTLLYLERKNQGPEELRSILSANDRQAAKATAPPQGLFLLQVKYPPSLDNQCRKI